MTVLLVSEADGLNVHVLFSATLPWSYQTYLHMRLYLWKVVYKRHVWGHFCCPDVCIVGPRPAPGLALAFTLCGTLLHAVPQVGELSSGAPGGQTGWQCAPPITAQP